MTFVVDLPQIETERLLLRGWQKYECEVLVDILGDEEQSRFVGGLKSRWQAWRNFAGMIGHYYLRGFTFFAVEEKQTGDCIGWVGPWRPEGWPDCEIGYALVRSAAGKGYATEAATAALRYAYNQLGWKSAVSYINAENSASQKVAQKLGAQRDGKLNLVDEFQVDVWRHLSPEQFKERFA